MSNFAASPNAANPVPRSLPERAILRHAASPEDRSLLVVRFSHGPLGVNKGWRDVAPDFGLVENHVLGENPATRARAARDGTRDSDRNEGGSTMRVPGKLLKGLGIGLAVVAVVFVVVRTWVVQAVIVGQIQAKVGGRVEIRDWWLNGGSAGVGRAEGPRRPRRPSPVWASAERVTTDLTLGGVLRGRFAPGKVTLEAPGVSLKFDEKGNLAHKVGGDVGRAARDAGPIPVVIADGAKVTLQQEGRPAMVVNGGHGPARPGQGRLILSARSNDPNWGPFEAHGEIDQAFKTGGVDLKTMGPVARHAREGRRRSRSSPPRSGRTSPRRRRRRRAEGRARPPARSTSIPRSPCAGRPSGARRSTSRRRARPGRVVVDDALVTFEDVSGQAIDGRVTAQRQGRLRRPGRPVRPGPRPRPHQRGRHAEIVAARRGGRHRPPLGQGPARWPCSGPTGRRPLGHLGRGGHRGGDDPGHPVQVD